MARPCGNCGVVGHGKKFCPELGAAPARKKKKRKSPTGGGSASMRRPEPAVSPDSSPIATKIRELHEAVKAGEAAKVELDAIREAFAAL